MKNGSLKSQIKDELVNFTLESNMQQNSLAEHLGWTKHRVSRLFNNNLNEFSLDILVEALGKIHKRVFIEDNLAFKIEDNVSEFIKEPEDYTDEEAYAAFVLNYFRMSATLQEKFEPFMKQFELYCKYENKTYRVVGASTLGDIFLTSYYYRSHGYEIRVDLKECSNFSPTSRIVKGSKDEE